jgi:hypothetical protein
MNEVWIAAFASLFAMRPLGIVVGFRDGPEIRTRVVRFDAIDEDVESEHGGTRILR